MKGYERPIVLGNADLAEGIFADSGEGECWTVKVSNDGLHNIHDGERWIEFIGKHWQTEAHYGETVYCDVVLEGGDITGVEAQNGYLTEWDGTTAHVTGTCNMNPGENWEFKLKVLGAALETVSVASMTIWDE